MNGSFWGLCRFRGSFIVTAPDADHVVCIRANIRHCPTEMLIAMKCMLLCTVWVFADVGIEREPGDAEEHPTAPFRKVSL
jgi:hypothetical protein